MIVSFMVEELKMDVLEAITKFNEARPPGNTK